MALAWITVDMEPVEGVATTVVARPSDRYGCCQIQIRQINPRSARKICLRVGQRTGPDMFGLEDAQVTLSMFLFSKELSQVSIVQEKIL
jgi:hypothetical protein